MWPWKKKINVPPATEVFRLPELRKWGNYLIRIDSTGLTAMQYDKLKEDTINIFENAELRAVIVDKRVECFIPDSDEEDVE